MGCAVLYVGSLVSAHCQCFFDRFYNPIRTDGKDGQFRFAAQLFFELDCLFYCVFVVFVHPPGKVGFFKPEAVGCRFEAGFHVGNLFDAYQDFHALPPILSTIISDRSRTFRVSSQPPV